MDIATLKAHLGDELFAQVEAKLKDVDGLTIIATNDGSWLPKSRLDSELTKQKDLKATISTLNQQLAEAKKNGDNAAALQTTIDNLKAQLTEKDNTISGMKRSGKIREALTKAKARNAERLERLLDMDKIGEDDKGNLTGLEDQIKALKESDSYLFSEEPGDRGGWGGGRNPNPGGAPTGNGEVNAAIRAAAGRS